MAIKDRDVRTALETLDTEIENYEAVIEDKDKEIFELQETISGLKQQVDEYEDRITELEEALAEAYLTSEPDNDGIQREDVNLPPGSGPHVSDPAGD